MLYRDPTLPSVPPSIPNITGSPAGNRVVPWTGKKEEQTDMGVEGWTEGGLTRKGCPPMITGMTGWLCCPSLPWCRCGCLCCLCPEHTASGIPCLYFQSCTVVSEHQSVLRRQVCTAVLLRLTLSTLVFAHTYV